MSNGAKTGPTMTMKWSADFVAAFDVSADLAAKQGLNLGQSAVVRWSMSEHARLVGELAALKTAPPSGPSLGAALAAKRKREGLTVRGLRTVLGYAHHRSIQLMESGAQPLSPVALAWLEGGAAWLRWQREQAIAEGV